MWHSLDNMIDRIQRRTASPSEPTRELGGVAIRRACDSDVPRLHDLAQLDSAAPLEGHALVAVVDGRICAAVALESGHVIADPFQRTVAAVELLELRVRQLRAADGRPQRGVLPRWIAGRARA